MVKKVKNELRKYIEEEIFPIYEKNDNGHNIEHINYVIRRSLEFAKGFSEIDINMVYTVASFHDIGHYIDKDKHEIISSDIFYNNEKMKEFFDDNQRKIIKEAIMEHRASLGREPKTIYGKIISTADRNVSVASILKRTHAYTVKHYKNLDLIQMMNRSYEHIKLKFGNDGYAKVWLVDEEFEKFKEEIRKLLNDRYLFAIKYMEENNIKDMKEQAKLFEEAVGIKNVD